MATVVVFVLLVLLTAQPARLQGVLPALLQLTYTTTSAILPAHLVPHKALLLVLLVLLDVKFVSVPLSVQIVHLSTIFRLIVIQPRAVWEAVQVPPLIYEEQSVSLAVILQKW